MSLQKAILGAAVLATTIGLVAPASAQTCTADKDCPQSYSCVSSGVVAPPPLPACPPSADCAKLDVDGSAGQIVIMTCEPKACSADADCGAGMVCYTDTSESCSGGGSAAPCPANTKCDGGVTTTITTTCTTTTKKMCAFKWQLPCTVNADCGDGFTCNPSVSVACSSSGTAGTSGSTSGGTGHATAGGSATSGAPVDGGSAPVAVDAAPQRVRVDAGTVGVTVVDGGTVSSCTTMSSFPGYCSVKVTTCRTDADCPSAWKCTDVSTAVGGNVGAPTGGPTGIPVATTGGAPAILADAGVAKECTSPLGGGYGYPVRGGGGSNGTAPQASGAGATGGTGGTSTGAKGGGNSNTPTGSNASASPSSGGCSLAGGGAEPAGLVLLAFVALRRARRRSR